jgi:hypothetical protein
MECQPFEHYEYLVLMFRRGQDLQRACEVLGVKKVQVTYPGGLKKIGLGRSSTEPRPSSGYRRRNGASKRG